MVAAAEDRARRLQEMAAALSAAPTPQRVADVVLSLGQKATGANAGSVALLDRAGTELVTLGLVGYSDEVAETFTSYPASADLPTPDSLRQGPLWLHDAAEVRAAYPHLDHFHATMSHEAVVALPLAVEGRAIGGLALSFSEARAFDADERAFLLTVADLCAQALERARLYESQRRDAERERFLADASTLLATPLEPRIALSSLARMAVPGPRGLVQRQPGHRQRHRDGRRHPRRSRPRGPRPGRRAALPRLGRRSQRRGGGDPHGPVRVRPADHPGDGRGGAASGRAAGRHPLARTGGRDDRPPHRARPHAGRPGARQRRLREAVPRRRPAVRGGPRPARRPRDRQRPAVRPRAPDRPDPPGQPAAGEPAGRRGARCRGALRGRRRGDGRGGRLLRPVRPGRRPRHVRGPRRRVRQGAGGRGADRPRPLHDPRRRRGALAGRGAGAPQPRGARPGRRPALPDGDVRPAAPAGRQRRTACWPGAATLPR